MPKLSEPKLITLKPRKAPALRAYAPKPADPGQRVTWTHQVPGYWTGATWGEGSWVAGETVTRTGTVWSAGPRPATIWAQPDDCPGDMAAVWLRSMEQVTAYPAGWARDAVRRAENVRRRGPLFAVVESVSEDRGWSCARTVTYKTLSWHCDQACPRAAGKERGADSRPRAVRDVVAILTGARVPSVQPRFCGYCVLLEQPESVALAS